MAPKNRMKLTAALPKCLRPRSLAGALAGRLVFREPSAITLDV
jgi:hypothetical protein